MGEAQDFEILGAAIARALLHDWDRYRRVIYGVRSALHVRDECYLCLFNQDREAFVLRAEARQRETGQ